MVPLLAIALALPAAACKHPASLSNPERLYTAAEETGNIRISFDRSDDLWAHYLRLKPEEQRRLRNDIIAARMYAIVMQYTEYESALMREVQIVDFGTEFTNAGLNMAGGIIGGDTSRVLSVVATGMTGINNAYAAKILRTQLVQNVQAAMRIGRHKQAAVILSNRECPIDAYPLGMALSDLETYYRAGTFQSGLVRLAQTVTKEEEKAKAGQDDKTPGAPADAQAKLAAAAAEEAIKANSTPKCTTSGSVLLSQPQAMIEDLGGAPAAPRMKVPTLRTNRPIRTTPLQELNKVMRAR